MFSLPMREFCKKQLRSTDVGVYCNSRSDYGKASNIALYITWHASLRWYSNSDTIKDKMATNQNLFRRCDHSLVQYLH